MTFDDLEYIRDLKEKGQYPKIHDDIFELHEHVPVNNVVDMGCCHGLLSHRLGQVYDHVVGIEPSKRYCKNLQLKDNVTYYNLQLNKQTIITFDKILKKHNIGGIFCRRVISEIYTTGGEELIQSLKNCLISNNVNYIALEGRIETKNSVNPINNTEKEINLFNDEYKVIATKHRAVVMKKRGF